jgi:hypothetical protein
MLLRDVIHDAQRRIMLSFLILVEGPVDLDMDWLAAPLEFLAAAAGARPIGVERHG